MQKLMALLIQDGQFEIVYQQTRELLNQSMGFRIAVQGRVSDR